MDHRYAMDHYSDDYNLEYEDVLGKTLRENKSEAAKRASALSGPPDQPGVPQKYSQDPNSFFPNYLNFYDMPALWLALAGVLTIILGASWIAVRRFRRRIPVLPDYEDFPEEQYKSTSKRPSRCSQHSIYGCITQNTPIDFVVPGYGNTLSSSTPPPDADSISSGSIQDLPMWARLALLDNDSPLLGGLNPELYKPDQDEAGEDWDFPDHHIGRLWFGLEYDPATERLVVSLVKAKNLPSRVLGSINCCDPFVRIWLLPDQRRYLQSKVKKKTCNPKFDENHLFQVSAKAVEERLLRFTVYDNDRGKKYNIIGHVLFQLKEYDVTSSDRVLIWRDLERDESQAVPNDLGTLLVSLCYNHNLERLTVTICEAKALHLTDESTEFDSLVKLCFMIGNKAVKTKKTSIAKKEPKYNESFQVKLPLGSINAASVVLQVTRVNSTPKEQCLGRVVLGSFMFTRGKTLEHWNETMAANHKQIRYWHKLT